MTLSLQSTLPPGCLPPGIDLQSLDPATRGMVETTGITLEAAIRLIDVKLDGTDAGRVAALVQSLLPEPSGSRSVEIPFRTLDPETAAIDIYTVMAVFQKFAQEMRNQAREARNAALEADIASLKNAAQEIRNAAQERMQQAFVQGAFQLAGGFTSAGLGVMGGLLGVASMGAGVSEVAGKQLGAWSKTFGDSAQGAGGMLGSGGTVGAAAFEQRAAEHDAQKARYDADARVHEQSMQQANEIMQHMMDVIRDIRDKISAIDQARSETNRSIARNV
ncbi:type III secretion system translocon subunit SctB [Castellaniella defragrans]|uniref:Uncharacterized protein n=1 Tax=Castellaniella defragrans TaxID=75697 RepID=A0A7W9TSK0_CASDE|nr:type III secretion system translocon subunit SctB [Castellaniella defragrans]KAB0602096.1 hypothetical protein F7Q88_16340 [Castellaniella defragrans]MBB6084957.1 hypothetical protein [Castellaniella defragrans]